MVNPINPNAYRLLHEGSLAFSEIEHNGMRVDVQYLKHAQEKVKEGIKTWTKRLRSCDEFKIQRRIYGEKTNLASRYQLGRVLFEELGFKSETQTKTGANQLNEDALDRINTKYTRGFKRLEKLKKLHNTYIKGVLREVEGEYIHPFFNLHTVTTYRSSSDSPNFQNIPARDVEIAKIIRQAFIPRNNHVLVEIDFKSLEVMVACCVTKDPKLTFDAVEGDMHRDVAAEIFCLPTEQVSKMARFVAKNDFVFAQFYGDFFKKIAPNMWRDLDRLNVTTKDGMPIKEWLKNKSIKKLGACKFDSNTKKGTFEQHLERIEKRFWNERFHVYRDWRLDHVQNYRRDGYFDVVTGFRCTGLMSKNQATNYPIQGPAFHCLLWSLVKLTKEMKQKKMLSKVVGQIHDSVVADIHVDELDDYLEMAVRITTKDLPGSWKWITVPFSVEAEIAETNWFEKKEIEL